jgi:hypothetical protein
MAEAGEAKKATAAYAPFKTFFSAIETLEHGLPNQIDRSVFPSLSGVTQSQLLGAFRFLGLINADGRPTADLHKLVEDKENRKPLMRKVIERSYPKLIALGLDKASPNSVDAELRNYGLQGETHVKAKSFFLQAAKYAEIPLSPYLQKVTRTSAPRKRRPGVKPMGSDIGNPITRSTQVATSGPSKQIMLENGVGLSLNASADLFNMTSSDRAFVLRLLDELEKYESEHPTSSEREESEDAGMEEE